MERLGFLKIKSFREIEVYLKFRKNIYFLFYRAFLLTITREIRFKILYLNLKSY
jgi:hypothetical protein